MASNTQAARSHFASIKLESGTARDGVHTPSASKKNVTALIAISVILLFGTAITLGTVFGLKKRAAVSSSSSNAMVDVVPFAASDDEDPPEPSTPQVLSEEVVEKQLNDAIDETVNEEPQEASPTPGPVTGNPTESVTVVKVAPGPPISNPSSYASSDTKAEKFVGSSPSQIQSKSASHAFDTDIEETVDADQPREDIASMSMMVFSSSLSMKTEAETDMLNDSNPEPIVHYNDWDWDFDCYKGQEKMQGNRRALKGSVLRGAKSKKVSKKVSSPRVRVSLSHIEACSCANIIVFLHINSSRFLQKCKTTSNSKSKSHKVSDKKQRLILIILSIVKKVKEISTLLNYIRHDDALMLLLDEQDTINEMMATMSQEDAMAILSIVEDTKSAVGSLPDGVIQVFAAIVGQQILGDDDILLLSETFDFLGDENDMTAMLQLIGKAVGGVEYLNNEEGEIEDLIEDVSLSMSMNFVDGKEIEFGRRQ